MCRIKLTVAQLLAVCALTPLAFSAVKIGSITLSEPPALERLQFCLKQTTMSMRKDLVSAPRENVLICAK